MEGLRIACLYSWGCPELKKMGIGVEKKVLDFIERPECKNQNLIRDILKKLDPYLYYQLINPESYPAEFFSRSVVRAHWIFDDNLLKPLTPRSVGLFCDEADIPDELRKKPGLVQRILQLGKRGGKPHHNFDVVLQAKEALQRLNQAEHFASVLLKGVNDCLVRAGKVRNCDWTALALDKVPIPTAPRKPLLIVETFAFYQERNKLSIKDSNETVELGFVDYSEAVGRCVSTHFGSAREILEDDEAKRLVSISQEALDFVAKSRFSSFRERDGKNS